MTPADYRAAVIEKLRYCQDPARVPALLAEADVVLSASRMGDRFRLSFWHRLEEAVERIAQEPPDPYGAAVRDLVFAAARASISQYQKRIIGEGEGTLRS